MLSDDTTSQFRAVLREHCKELHGCREQVQDIVKSAATEAREAGLTGEQFVIWVKNVWEGLVSDGGLQRRADTTQTRDVVISSAIKAYYVQ